MGLVVSIARTNRATSVAELSRVGLELILERGFDAVTVDDIADAAGIGRRTFFRYFDSKNDLPWGEFDALVAAMREFFREAPAEEPMGSVLRRAVLSFNRFPPEEIGNHRQRMRLLLGTPSLVAHSSLRYASWRAAIAEFVAARRGVDAGELLPQAVGWAMLSAAMTAYEHWLVDEGSELDELLAASLDVFAAVTEGL